MDVVFYIEIGGGGEAERGTAHVGSFGEREHALSFARQIRQAGYRPKFVVGPLIADHITRAGFEPAVFSSADWGVELVKDIDPAMVIGCELFNVSPESANGLMKLGVPIGTIDGTTLSHEINTNPFDMPEYRRELVLPDHFYAFRPCPINDIGANTETVSYWSLFPDVSTTAKDPQRYAALGLDAGRRTVLLPIAPWAIGSAFIFGLAGYYQTLVERIVDGLDAAGGDIDLVFISMFRPEALTVERKNRVTVHYPGLIDYDNYDHLLRSCDAIVSDNIIQTSVSKAAMMGTPHLIVQNMRASDMPYRYNMFPLKVLFPPDRDYAQIVDTAEYGEPDDIREKLIAILNQGYADDGARTRRDAYRQRVAGLSQPGQILEHILGRAAEARAAAQ